MTAALQEGHTTLISHEFTPKLLKIGSIIVIEDPYTLTFTLIRLSQSKGSILKVVFHKHYRPWVLHPHSYRKDIKLTSGC